MSRATNRRWALIVSTTAGLFAAAYVDVAIATADLSSPGDLCMDVAQLASIVGPGVEQSLPGAASALADSPAGPILGAGLAGAAGAVPAGDGLLSPTGLAGLPTSQIASLAPAAAPITQEAGVVGPAGGGVAVAPITQEAGVVGPAAAGGAPAGGGAPLVGSPLGSPLTLADSALPLLGGMPLADLLCCP
ncbi:MAG: hypothetical protein J2P17_14905 [Mycobacterium sp.]|nr:hypothetical protein [Mycobacterium sp.]